MNATEFVTHWKEERDMQLVSLFAGTSAASQQLEKMGLTSEQRDQLWQLLDTATTDLLYTLLTGLDGGTGIGNGEQQSFNVRDEDDNLIEDMVTEAYMLFHEAPTNINQLRDLALAASQKSHHDQSIHEVFTATAGAEGIVRCPHCQKSFSTTSDHSWDGQRHRSCGTHLRIVAPE